MRNCMLMLAMCSMVAASIAADTAAPADELARVKQAAAAPEAPEGFRRPKNWRPVLYPRSLLQISKENSREQMDRAKKTMARVRETNVRGKYHADGKSIDTHRCPEWFVDAKLGIFIDWGLWSLASWCPYVKGARLYPDWYELRCREGYSAGMSVREYHKKNWGDDFKSDHFIDLFKAERFNAKEMMRLFRSCGARYVIPFLKHHSGFCLWDSSWTFRDVMDQGPHRDLTREMVDACREQGLKFGVYTSQAGEWIYPILQEDGSIRMWIETQRYQPYSADMEWKCSGKVAVRDFVNDYMVPMTVEFIDKYDPDIFWGDYDWMTYAHENGSYDIVAYLYNHADGRKEVASNDRLGKAKPEEIVGRFTKIKRNWLRTVRGDYYTDEWGDTEECLDPAKWHPWESCSGISKSYGNHWMENFDKSMVMTETEFVAYFTDIVARGGNLLLLVNLDPQGAIPAVQKERLEQIGKWLNRYGAAIYGTRICAPYSTADVNYTQSKDGCVKYAIVKKPTKEVALRCSVREGARICVVGSDAPLSFCRKNHDMVVVAVPGELAAVGMPFALSIE